MAFKHIPFVQLRVAPKRKLAPFLSPGWHAQNKFAQNPVSPQPKAANFKADMDAEMHKNQGGAAGCGGVRQQDANAEEDLIDLSDDDEEQKQKFTQAELDEFYAADLADEPMYVLQHSHFGL
jgi:hypothetical protein